DITVIKPVFLQDELLGYIVNRAHHSDIGGETPGSMPGNSETLEEEGIVISPRLLVDEGTIDQEVIELLRKARSPRERIGDIRAQIGANEKGATEFKKTVEKFGLKDYHSFKDQVMRYSEKRTRNMIKDLPNTIVGSEDFMEWKNDVKLKIQIKIKDDRMMFNFSGTDPQVKGNINAPKPVTYSAVYYVLRCLLPADVPVNNGCYRPLDVHIPEGSVLNPEPPAAVSAGNVETSQRVVELILRSLFEILPEKIPAESQGTMNNLIIGSEDFTYYETIGGGAGATSSKKGESGVHVHMTNTKNTPIESIENEHPLRVTAYKLREDSGGEGENSGGDGIIREIKLLEDAEVSIQSERRESAPKGVMGGKDGAVGHNFKIQNDKIEKTRGKITFELLKGESIRIETPGGGGWGEP
ncbi:MAG: hydantoinase B/oxoprolinase family protein, partial [Candidatus Thermoplasmatota archaeon]